MCASPWRRSLRAVLLAVSAWAAVPLSASANHSGNGYHGPRTNHPVTVRSGNNLASNWDPLLEPDL